jgi:hypothetical protein
MDFLNPKVLGDEPFFRQRYRLPIERYGDMSSLRDLKARVVRRPRWGPAARSGGAERGVSTTMSLRVNTWPGRPH